MTFSNAVRNDVSRNWLILHLWWINDWKYPNMRTCTMGTNMPCDTSLLPTTSQSHKTVNIKNPTHLIQTQHHKHAVTSIWGQIYQLWKSICMLQLKQILPANSCHSCSCCCYLWWLQYTYGDSNTLTQMMVTAATPISNPQKAIIHLSQFVPPKSKALVVPQNTPFIRHICWHQLPIYEPIIPEPCQSQPANPLIQALFH